MDSLEDRVKGFFKKCGSTNNLKQEWKEEQMEKLKQVSSFFCITDIIWLMLTTVWDQLTA